MKLTGILKDKADKAETMEAKKDIIEEAEMELSDDELEGVTGGQNLLYRGERINQSNLLMDDSVSTQPINLLHKDSAATKTKRSGGRTDGMMSC